MPAPASPAPSSAHKASRLPRLAVVAVLVVLVAHAALLAWLFVRAREGSLFELEMGEFASVAAGALAIAGWLLWRWPHRTRAIVAAGGVITTAALFTIGSLATVALMLLNAYVVGRLVSRSLGAAASDDPPSITALVGTALWTGFVAATISFHVHYPAAYTLMLFLPLVAFPQVTAEAVVRIGRSLARDDTIAVRERVWIAILVTLAVTHALLAARPEIGYDAGTMHLQFAQILRHEKWWAFDTSRYAWAVMPLGADLQFAAAFLLDGENAVRLLNLAFAALMGDVAYRLIRMHARRQIDIHTNVQVRELRIYQRVDSACGSSGDSNAGRKTASGDRDAVAYPQFCGLTVHRAYFRVLDNLRVGISQHGVRRQARQGHHVIG